MTSHGGVRRGSQVPRIEHYPLYHSSAGDDAVDVAAAANLILDPWQEHVLRAALGERGDGRWSSFRVALVVPRQNGKNAILEARELAGLLLFGEEVVTHTAHQFSTAHKAMIALMNRLKSSPLMSEVKGFAGGEVEDIRDVDGFKTGNFPSITMKNGNQLRYAARSGDASRGFTGDLVVMDEAYSLRSSEMDALIPTMAAKSLNGNAQVWFTSSAGMPDSDHLASLRQQGIDQVSDRMTYMEWSAVDDAEPTDRDAWYQANPGLGYRISEEYVQDEFDTLVVDDGSDEGFKRERLGIWATLGGEPLFSSSLWSSMATAEPIEKGVPIAFALDVPPSRDVATLCAAAEFEGGRIRFEVVDRFDNFHIIPDRLRTLQDKWEPSAIMVDAMSAAGSMIDGLRRDGVRTRQLNGRQYVEACGQFYDTVMTENARHSDQKELNDAIAAAERKVRANSSTWVWARKDTMTDISPLIGCTLALHGLTRHKPKDKKKSGRLVFV